MTDLCYGLHCSKSAILFLQYIQLFQFRLNMRLVKKSIPLQGALEGRSEKENNYKHKKTGPSVVTLVSGAPRRPINSPKELLLPLCNFRYCHSQGTNCTTVPPLLGNRTFNQI